MAPPASPREALDRASAAYDFGDIRQMIELSRLVAEGALPASEGERAEALKLLGIGLFLSGRTDGARQAFVDLLRLRPDAALDPAITRPEVVAFFKEVRRQQRPKKAKALTLLPPLGQLQNGDTGRAWLIGGLEFLTLGTAVGTYVWLLQNARYMDSYQCDPKYQRSTCETLKTVQWVSTFAFAGVYALGVVDALLRFDREPDDEARLTFAIHPTGAALRLSF